MKTTFYGWTWDSNDLIQCKNALCGLLNEGHDESVLNQLDFGSLDVEAVIDEYNDVRLSAYEAEHC